MAAVNVTLSILKKTAFAPLQVRCPRFVIDWRGAVFSVPMRWVHRFFSTTGRVPWLPHRDAYGAIGRQNICHYDVDLVIPELRATQTAQVLARVYFSARRATSNPEKSIAWYRAGRRPSGIGSPHDGRWSVGMALVCSYRYGRDLHAHVRDGHGCDLGRSAAAIHGTSPDTARQDH
jgi:hypothetical protein